MIKSDATELGLARYEQMRSELENQDETEPNSDA